MKGTDESILVSEGRFLYSYSRDKYRENNINEEVKTKASGSNLQR